MPEGEHVRHSFFIRGSDGLNDGGSEDICSGEQNGNDMQRL